MQVVWLTSRDAILRFGGGAKDCRKYGSVVQYRNKRAVPGRMGRSTIILPTEGRWKCLHRRGRKLIRTAKLLEFRQEDGWYYFTFAADGEDRYWVEEILRTVPLTRRSFDARIQTWGLRVGPDTERVLTETFANGRECLESVKAQ